MLSYHRYRRIGRSRPIRTELKRPTSGALLALISEHVIKRFDRISDTYSLAVPLALPITEGFEEPAAGPCHPACAEHEGRDYCRESLQLHLAELGQRPETHWHKCDFGRLCAHVPVVYNAQCVAVVKLACPASMTEKDFSRHVELMDVLVRDFVVSQGGALGRFTRAKQAAPEPDAGPTHGSGQAVDERPSHPQVLRALQHIEEHLKDPNLTVRRIADELGIYPSYLSQLFVDQVGQRMSRFIATRRVELAKSLLATTDWQIKRIARETGYANDKWFFHVFGVFTGLTPCEFRRRSQCRMDSSRPDRKT